MEENKPKVNTTASMKEFTPNERRQVEASLVKARIAFEGEKQVKVSIPKNLANRIGKTLPLGINGVRIVLPVDGSEHLVPTSFSDHLRQYLANVRI